MKKLLFILALSAAAVTTQAQTTTNLVFGVTVETVTAGVTNQVQSKLRMDASVKKEALSVNGFAWAFASYRAGGGALAFEDWLKTDIKDRAKVYADAKLAVDNAVLAAKISSLLLSNPDLLTASDLNNLSTIAAKAP